MAKTKFFRVAVEGDTVDGRKIEKSWLTDAAATYNPETYAARVNMEHIRGITADKPFKAYGDVLALETRTIDLAIGGKTEKRTALFAQLDATDELVAINRDNQKLYSSIEVNPNFAGTGKAYMVGLAVTDSPASLGTERLTFASKASANVLSAAEETRFELEAGDPPVKSEAEGFFAELRGLMKGFTGGKSDPVVETPVTPPAPPANDNDAKFGVFGSALEKLAAGIEAQGKAFTATLTALEKKVTAVEASIENTEAPREQLRRRPATGGQGDYARTDC